MVYGLKRQNGISKMKSINMGEDKRVIDYGILNLYFLIIVLFTYIFMVE